MHSLTTLLAFIAAVSILVTIHELGHYWVARLCNVKILRFSVGFGRPLLLRRLGKDRTEWVIAALPLGGYVKMLDERDMEVAGDEKHRAFNRQPVWKRSAIVIAGPVANLLLACILYWVLFVQGIPGLKPHIAAPVAASAAAKAGFRDFDLIRRIADQEVSNFQDVRWQLLKEALKKGTVDIEVEDSAGNGALRRLDLDTLTKEDLDQDFLIKLGLIPSRPPVTTVISDVLAGKPAARAGLEKGDRVVFADGKPLRNWDDLVSIVSASAQREIDIGVVRGDREIHIKVVPDDEADASGKRTGRIGIVPSIDREAAQKLYTTVRYDPATALVKAIVKVGDMSVFSLKMMGRMITGDVSLKNLSGPITIADYAGQSARQGLSVYIGFLALVSISIGILNLLPVPVLDGGQLVYHVVEILKGSPVSERIMEVGQQIGLALLLGLMVFAFYNDIQRLVSG
jgi:regulator of sigma E protease